VSLIIPNFNQTETVFSEGARSAVY